MEDNTPKLIDFYEEDDREVEIYEYKGIKIWFNLFYEYEYTIDNWWYSSLKEAVKAIDKKELRNVKNITDEEIEESKILKEEERKKNLAINIVELFEDLLDEKGIEIPCADETEQKDRYEGDNDAKLYGMEYWNLIDTIQAML